MAAYKDVNAVDGIFGAETYGAVHGMVFAYLHKASDREAVFFWKTASLSPL